MNRPTDRHSPRESSTTNEKDRYGETGRNLGVVRTGRNRGRSDVSLKRRGRTDRKYVGIGRVPKDEEVEKRGDPLKEVKRPKPPRSRLPIKDRG